MKIRCEKPDVIVDVGPGAGIEGGRILTVGSIAEIEKHPNP